MSVKSENTKDQKMRIKGFGFMKLFLFLFIIISVIGVAIYAFLDINPANIFTEGINGLYNTIITKSKSELTEKVRIIGTYEDNGHISVTTNSNNLVIADNSSVRVLDMDGNEKAYIPVSLKKPHVQSYKKNVIIADLEGRFLALMNEEKLLWQKSLDEDIVYASISDSWILIITKSKEAGYKRSIRAWSIDGQEVSIRNLSNYYPISAKHYPEFDRTTFVVNGVDISGLEANGFFDFLNPEMNQKASIRGDNEVMATGVSVGDKLLLYGEKSLFLIDNLFNTVWQKKFDSPSITAAGSIDGKYPLVAVLDTEILSRESRHMTNVKILNQDSTERHNIVIDDMVTGIVSEGRTSALIAGYEVFFINADGKILDTYTSKTSISGVFLANEKLTYIVSGGNISRVNIDVGRNLFGLF